jgi:ribonucleoside-diphosphate reductase alpha chain
VDIGVTNGAGEIEAEPTPAVKAAAEISGADAEAMSRLAGRAPAPVQAPADAPACPDCGSLMTRNGACYRCHNCGTTSGCG